MGDALGARNVYMAVLRRTGEKHIESLVGYGRLALMSNQADKGVSSLLRAIMTAQMPWCGAVWTHDVQPAADSTAAGEATYAAPADSAVTIATEGGDIPRR